MTDTIEDLMAAGILDPAKVTRSGLTNACGIAGIMLTTQAIMVSKPKPKAWATQNPQSHACTVAGVKTRCEGFFTASVNGKVQTISREAAIQRQLQNLPWSTGVREIASVRTSRIQQEKDRVARAAAEEAAKLQAIEDARLQAERQAQEAKAAEQRALPAGHAPYRGAGLGQAAGPAPHPLPLLILVPLRRAYLEHGFQRPIIKSAR
jgi:hypothetical protein